MHVGLGSGTYLTEGLSADTPGMDMQPFPMKNGQDRGRSNQVPGTQMALQQGSRPSGLALLCSPSPILMVGCRNRLKQPVGRTKVSMGDDGLRAADVTLCTDSWAIFKGLLRWLPTWAINDWMVAK